MMDGVGAAKRAQRHVDQYYDVFMVDTKVRWLSTNFFDASGSFSARETILKALLCSVDWCHPGPLFIDSGDRQNFIT